MNTETSEIDVILIDLLVVLICIFEQQNDDDFVAIQTNPSFLPFCAFLSNNTYKKRCRVDGYHQQQSIEIE